MRILTWNIRAGGGVRLPRIAEAIAVHQADVLVLTEYRSGEAGQRLRAVLRDLGFGWLSPVEPPGIRNGVLIAARSKPRSVAHVTEHVPEPWRMLAVTIDRVRLFGIYMPNLRAKIPYWEALIEASTPHSGGRALALAIRAGPMWMNQAPPMSPRCSWTRSRTRDFAMSGATGFRMGGNIRGTATAAMGSVLITLLLHLVWRGGLASSGTRTRSVPAGCQIIPRC